MHSVDAQKQTTSALCEDSCQSHIVDSYGLLAHSCFLLTPTHPSRHPEHSFTLGKDAHRLLVGLWTVVRSPAGLYFPSTLPLNCHSQPQEITGSIPSVCWEHCQAVSVELRASAGCCQRAPTAVLRRSSSSSLVLTCC